MKKNSLLLFFFLGWMNIAFNQQANIRYDKGSERYGVINSQKDTIVSFSFNHIAFVEPNFFLVSHSNDKLKTTYGLYDTLGNNLLPVQYTGILVDATASFIHFYTKDSSGIYEPIQHKKLTFEGQQYVYPIYSPRVKLKYYCVQSEDEFTLFDTEWNKLFSFTGQMIQHRENVHGNSQFVVKNKRTKLLGLLSQEGQLLIPCSYTSLEQPIDHFATFGNGSEWLGRTEKGYDFYTLNTENNVLHADFIGCFHHSLIVQQGKRWQILDEQLKVLYESADGPLSFQSSPFDPKTFDIREMYCEMCAFHSVNFIQTLSTSAPYAYEIKYGTPKKNCTPFSEDCIQTAPLFGLVNYKTQQKIPVRYRYLLQVKADSMLNKNESSFNFWGLEKQQHSWKLAIYSSELILLQQLLLSDTSIALIQQALFERHENTSVMLQNDNKQYGLITYDGTIVQPFDASICYPLYDYPRRQTQFYVRGHERKYQLFDEMGKKCSDITFDTLYVPSVNFTLTVLGKNEKGYSLFDENGACLIENGTRYLYEHRVAGFGERFPYHTPTAYIVKDDHLYMLHNNNMVLINDQFTPFTNDTLRLSFGWLVDRKGKIVSMEWKR